MARARVEGGSAGRGQNETEEERPSPDAGARGALRMMTVKPHHRVVQANRRSIRPREETGRYEHGTACVPNTRKEGGSPVV